MDAVLIEEWLGEQEPLAVIDAASVALARQQVRERAASLNLSEIATGSVVNIVSELGHNQLAHARRGNIVVRSIERDGTPGLEIIAADAGRGINAPSEALHATPRPPDTNDPALKKSLGSGLAAVLELADETDFDVRVGEGTCVWARKFARPVPRRRQVGIYGRPYPGEDVSGDHATFVREHDGLLVGLADGLGHGPFAREAAQIAIASVRSPSFASIERILGDCHSALRETRGSVMAVARIHEPYGALEIASVGNVSTRLYGPQLARRFSDTSFVLGSAGPLHKVALETTTAAARDVLILFSDGLSSRFDLDGELDLLREHPIVIAHQLVERFARDNDDALVLVAG